MLFRFQLSQCHISAKLPGFSASNLCSYTFHQHSVTVYLPFFVAMCLSSQLLIVKHFSFPFCQFHSSAKLQVFSALGIFSLLDFHHFRYDAFYISDSSYYIIYCMFQFWQYNSLSSSFCSKFSLASVVGFKPLKALQFSFHFWQFHISASRLFSFQAFQLPGFSASKPFSFQVFSFQEFKLQGYSTVQVLCI